MTSLTRLGVCAVVAGGLLLASATMVPQSLTAVGLDFWRLPELHQEIARGQFRHAELTDLDARLCERISSKSEVVSEVIAGRLTLFEAAARFRVLNAMPPEMSELVSIFPGRSEEEKLCRQVICWVESDMNLAQPPSRVEAVVSRLEADLAEQLSRTGKVTLPVR